MTSKKKEMGKHLVDGSACFAVFFSQPLPPQFCDIPQTKKAKKLSIKGTLKWSIHFVQCLPAAVWKNHGKSTWA